MSWPGSIQYSGGQLSRIQQQALTEQTLYTQPHVYDTWTSPQPIRPREALHLPALRIPDIHRHVQRPWRSMKIEDLISPANDSQHDSTRTRSPDTSGLTYQQLEAVTGSNLVHRHGTTHEPDFEAYLRQLAAERPASSTAVVEGASISSRRSASRSPSQVSELVIDVSTYGDQSQDTAASAASDDRLYQLSFRQQPSAARACGHGDRDRRVIDPPPILELRITNKNNGFPSEDMGVNFAMHCSLIDAETGNAAGFNVSEHDSACRITNAMMGSSAASPFKGKDEYGMAGTFFVFADLSCRFQGRFRLRFTLLRIDLRNMAPGAKHLMVASAESNVFTAYTAKDFPGMQASTPLLRALRRQGLTVSIKKGSEARKMKSKLGRRSFAGSDSDDDDDASTRVGEKRRAMASSPGSSVMSGAKRMRHGLALVS